MLEVTGVHCLETDRFDQILHQNLFAEKHGGRLTSGKKADGWF